MIANIKNGKKSKKPFIYQRKTRYCEKVLNILWDEGFILGYEVLNSNKFLLKIFLKYKNGNSIIKFLNPISKPGFKIYFSTKKLWKLKINTGILIVSTNKGIMTSEFCKKKNLGGELICFVK